jgi:hypothetical protein
MMNEVDALPPAETSKQSIKCVIYREFVPEGQTVLFRCNGTVIIIIIIIVIIIHRRL